MSVITWNSSYAIGVAEIDNQHKKIVDLINKLHDAISAGSQDATIKSVYNELVSYTFTHFTYEESLMRKANYNDLADHLDVHKSIIARVKGLQSKYVSGDVSALNETLEFLKNWLFKHIAGTDKKYVPSLHAVGIK